MARSLATGSDDGTARLWDVVTHRQIGAPIIRQYIASTAVAFSPDGKTLATGSDDGTARLWNVATHRQIGAPMTADTYYVRCGSVQPGRQDRLPPPATTARPGCGMSPPSSRSARR